MRTTLDIGEDLLDEVVKVTKERTKSRAVTKALREYIRRTKIEELKKLSGKIRLKSNWKDLREMELNE